MNPQIRIYVTYGDHEGKIDLELYPDKAPITVKNFLSLVDRKYYDGVVFHRIIKNFMIQTGGYYVLDDSLYEKENVPSIKVNFQLTEFLMIYYIQPELFQWQEPISRTRLLVNFSFVQLIHHI